MFSWYIGAEENMCALQTHLYMLQTSWFKRYTMCAHENCGVWSNTKWPYINMVCWDWAEISQKTWFRRCSSFNPTSCLLHTHLKFPQNIFTISLWWMPFSNPAPMTWNDTKSGASWMIQIIVVAATCRDSPLKKKKRFRGKRRMLGCYYCFWWVQPLWNC